MFELPELMTLSFIQRKIIKWRNEKDIVAESSNVFAFKEDGAIKVRVSYVSDFVLSMLKDFSYDRKTNYWTGASRKDKKTGHNGRSSRYKNLREGALLPLRNRRKEIIKTGLICMFSVFVFLMTAGKATALSLNPVALDAAIWKQNTITKISNAEMMFKILLGGAIAREEYPMLENLNTASLSSERDKKKFAEMAKIVFPAFDENILTDVVEITCSDADE